MSIPMVASMLMIMITSMVMIMVHILPCWLPLVIYWSHMFACTLAVGCSPVCYWLLHHFSVTKSQHGLAGLVPQHQWFIIIIFSHGLYHDIILIILNCQQEDFIINYISCWSNSISEASLQKTSSSWNVNHRIYLIVSTISSLSFSLRWFSLIISVNCLLATSIMAAKGHCAPSV